MSVRKIVLTNLAVLAAGLAAVELVFGSWLIPHNINLLNLSKDLIVTFDAADLYEDPESTMVTYRRDRYGLRGPYEDVSQIDILTIGGSTTDQRCLSEGRTWQDVLARKFSERGRKIQIANAGVDGQTTRGNLKNFDLWFPAIPNLRPRFVLLYVGINDFWLKESEDSRFDALEGGPASVLDKIVTRSAIYSVYRTLKGMQAARAAGLPHSRMNFLGNGVGFARSLPRILRAIDEGEALTPRTPVIVAEREGSPDGRRAYLRDSTHHVLHGRGWPPQRDSLEVPGIGDYTKRRGYRTAHEPAKSAHDGTFAGNLRGSASDLASELEFDFADFIR